MIRVSDLIKWAEKMAVERNARVPNGYIKGQDLYKLATAVKKLEPRDLNLKDLGDRF